MRMEKKKRADLEEREGCKEEKEKIGRCLSW